MAEKITPHFHNERGVRVIYTGSKEFMCIGAKPPFDHPHEFIDMGGADEAICPYCSTLYRYKAELGPGGAEPADCLWDGSSTTPDMLVAGAPR
ncbi:MAG: zinc-finger domain-containing protein [Salinarimonadaceae bacterium]|nr:MAG: zinc-finger domain-containing protein [Salinarimonadaceae bacterium]